MSVKDGVHTHSSVDGLDGLTHISDLIYCSGRQRLVPWRLQNISQTVANKFTSTDSIFNILVDKVFELVANGYNQDPPHILIRKLFINEAGIISITDMAAGNTKGLSDRGFGTSAYSPAMSRGAVSILRSKMAEFAHLNIGGMFNISFDAYLDTDYWLAEEMIAVAKIKANMKNRIADQLENEK